MPLRGRIRHFKDFAAVKTPFDKRGVLEGVEEIDFERGEREGRGSFWMKLSDEDLANLQGRHAM